jgi:1,4-alpha-glucan branching enzyme
MSKALPIIIQNDPWLAPYQTDIVRRHEAVIKKENALCNGKSLGDFATGYLFFGLHHIPEGWVFREWAPNATAIFLVGDFNNWQVNNEYSLTQLKNGIWEIKLPETHIKHLHKYKLLIRWNGGEAYRLPAWGNCMVQDATTKVFDAQVWAPSETFQWKNANVQLNISTPYVYEAHIGMATSEEKVGSYTEFKNNILPRIKKAGYNVIQLMAIQEHPYYGSFGYHVSNFFAASSRFGTPDELKSLIDAAHGMGIAVIMDLVHSHAVKNEMEGLGLFDGTEYQYFHTGARRVHVAWDSLCFNYSKPEVLHFLLSNCKYWLEEYTFDGFRFDGITSMIYLNHGLDQDFTNFKMYYDGNQDEDALIYLTLANILIHQTKPSAITIAEEMSGMPGLGAKFEHGGYGFDFRLSMGVPDFWIKLIKEIPDEKWSVGQLFHEMSGHRIEEKTISYAESHDQALVGDKTIFFRLTDKEMYSNMDKSIQSPIIDRGLALHKMIRLLTISTAGAGYLNFMGNEFGHPEWIDFPREGNNWSYKHALRQWNLADNPFLKYQWLLNFDQAMIEFFLGSNCFEVNFPNLLNADEYNQVLAFSRMDWIFIFNFNPEVSFTNYKIPVEAGKYQIKLTTDEPEFGGQNRIDKQQMYFTTSDGEITTLKRNFLSLYIPARSALVAQKIVTKSIY